MKKLLEDQKKAKEEERIKNEKDKVEEKAAKKRKKAAEKATPGVVGNFMKQAVQNQTEATQVGPNGGKRTFKRRRKTRINKKNKRKTNKSKQNKK